MPSSHLILWYPLLLLPSIFPSIRVFSNESALHIRWPKYWSFSFSISPSNEYSALFSYKIDFFNLPAVQETLRSLLQHHSSKASILWHSAFFTVQLSQLYVTFVGKVISLLFNTLSRFLISFPAKKQSFSDFMAAVTIHSDFRDQEEEICQCFHLFPFYLPWSDGAESPNFVTLYFLACQFPPTAYSTAGKWKNSFKLLRTQR